MKLKKVIAKAEAFVDSEDRGRKEKKKYLKRVLKKLSDHERSLKKRLAATSDKDEQNQLKKKLARTHAQRKKGIGLLKSMKRSA